MLIRRSRLKPARGQPPLARRLERAAATMNPFLLTIAIGLATVYVSCLAALELKQLGGESVARGGAEQAPTLDQIAVTGLPRS